MSTVREHLANLHKVAAAHHSDVAASHERLAKCFSKLNKSDSSHDEVAAEHEKLAALHKSQSEFHEQQAQGCMKSQEDELNKVAPVPEGLSALTPDNPHFRRGLTAIPRSGAPTPGSQEQKVAPEFAKLVALEED